MHFTSALYAQHALTCTLVLVRIACLTIVVPIFPHGVVPWRIRGLLALALAAVVVPLAIGRSTPHCDSAGDFLVMAGAEALVGLALGLGVLVLFSAMHLAGNTISQMSGLSLADVVSPGFDAEVPVFSRLFFYVTLAVFLVIGGHRRVVEALVDTFVWLPPGQGTLPRSIGQAMASLLAESFSLGIRAAAPAMMALLLATIILALASRTIPQLNVMSLGLSFNVATALVAVAASLGGAAWVFQDRFEPALGSVVDAFRSAAVSPGHGAASSSRNDPAR